MAFLPLLAIPMIFLIVALVKPRLQKHVQWNICAICVAVSLTWVLLVAFRWSGIAVDPLSIGILMGMSVTGVMYRIEVVFKAHALKHLWVTRLVVVLGGYAFILSFLQGDWRVASVVATTTILLLTIVGFLLQGVTHEDAVHGAGIRGQETSLLKKLDDCC